MEFEPACRLEFHKGCELNEVQIRDKKWLFAVDVVILETNNQKISLQNAFACRTTTTSDTQKSETNL